MPKNFASDRQVLRSHQPGSRNFGLGYKFSLQQITFVQNLTFCKF
ncbi:MULTISPECIES: hypothetical protein [unclassified Microcoleus]